MDDDGAEERRLRSRISELEALLESTRGERDQALNGLQEQIAVLEQDAAASRERLRDVERENHALFGLLKSRSIAGVTQMVVEPFWPATPVCIDRCTAFLLMPFRPPWADAVRATVTRAAQSLGMRCRRADELSGRTVMSEVWKSICECGVLIADLTDSNANVTYELGLADAVRQSAVLICQTSDPRELPFDLLGQRLIVYSTERLDLLESQLVDRIRSMRPTIGSVR